MIDRRRLFQALVLVLCFHVEKKKTLGKFKLYRYRHARGDGTDIFNDVGRFPTVETFPRKYRGFSVLLVVLNVSFLPHCSFFETKN